MAQERAKAQNEERVDIPKPEGHFCFACGTANPIGLNLQFYNIGDAVFTDITLGKYHEGWQNMAHGGIISTLVDETMSWTILYLRKVFFVTRKMDVKYIKPVHIGTPLKVKGEIVDQTTPPRLRVRAEIRDGENRLLVRSTGEYVELSKDQLSMVPEDPKAEMAALFQQY